MAVPALSTRTGRGMVFVHFGPLLVAGAARLNGPCRQRAFTGGTRVNDTFIYCCMRVPDISNAISVEY